MSLGFKALHKVQLLALFIFLGWVCNSYANEPENRMPRDQTFMCERTGEGFNDCYLIKGNKKNLIWKSFWGISEFKFSPDGKYLAVRDVNRFNLLSPIVIFRIKPVIDIVYITPGNFESDEKHFNFRMGEITTSTFTISVVKNEFSTNSSRAKEVFGFSYDVKLQNLKPVDPQYFSEDDPHYFNPNVTTVRLKVQ